MQYNSSLKVKKAVFPVGGLGTRFLPATKAMPKEMLPVGAKPIIQHAFEEAIEAGIEQFIFITGRNKNAIENHFDHSYELQSVLGQKEKNELLETVKGWLPKAGSIAFVRQQQPAGLGHAVWCARHLIGAEPFAVILADEMLSYDGSFLKKMAERYDGTSNLIAVTEVSKDNVEKYGIIEHANNWQNDLSEITGMVEKPQKHLAPSNHAIIGRYILSPEIFQYLEIPNEIRESSREIQLTDAMDSMLKDKHKFMAVNHKGKRFDCGSQLGYLEANIAFAKRDWHDKSEIDQILKNNLEN